MNDDLRRLPGSPIACARCRRPIVFARTMAGPNGPGGKAMPLDVVEHLAGNVAVTIYHRGELRCRVLTKDDRVDRPLEYAAMPHFATCPGTPEGSNPRLPPDVTDLQAVRHQRARAGARR